MNLQKNVLLKNYSNYKIGGPAKFFVEVKSVEELQEALEYARDNSEKVFILGGGTNILISDEGFKGLIIYNKIVGIKRERENLIVGSGVSIKDLLNFCVENSLSGFEWAGGLPGTIAGAVRGNAGAFKGEIKDSVVKVESFDTKTFVQKARTNKECKFGYRSSIFKTKEAVLEFITHVVLRLVIGDKNEIEKRIQQEINYRFSRHPMEHPSIGSTFKNISLDSLPQNLQKEFTLIVKNDPFPAVLTTKILALCNLKGRRVGGAMISEKHPNFIVNVDNAKASDVKTLIKIAKQAVREKYNILLEEEIIYLN